ncbi:hypothetical protein BJX63DRAFT_399469 [Aspergillus granulosus]|uniref:Zn(2)-C6 fungal-type domain-containing protein n=1 Tax=Aspergillus granulosus TaxID=176169 RepID=A0ABR4H8U9_9EURO
MMAPPIHPSQRRSACELCRRHKSKCQRIHRNDVKCARCMMLDAECIAGQQKKVGRPKHAATSARDAPTDPEFESRPTANAAFRRKEPDLLSQQSHPLPHGRSQECPSFSYSHGQLGSSNTSSPAPAPSAVAAAEDFFVPAMIWSTSGTQTSYQRSLTWNMARDNHESPLADFDSSINFTSSDDPLPEPAINRIYPTPATLAMAGQENPPGDIASTDAMVKLSKIDLDLHIRLAATEKNRTVIKLNSFILPEGPLFIENYTLAEFILKTSEDFLQILTRLCSSQSLVALSLQSYQGTSNNAASTSSSILSYPAPQPLLAPLALAITSIFTQLISLYEVVLEHLITGIERLSTEPLTPFASIKFQGLPLNKPCTQGMIFSNTIVELLEEMEGALGINKIPRNGKTGLLSSRQIDVLWSELDGRVGITPREDTMKPAHVKQLFRKAAVILHEFSMRTETAMLVGSTTSRASWGGSL